MKKFGTLRVGNIEWPVYYATVEEYPPINGNDGYTDPERGIIVIDPAFAKKPSHRKVVLLHEAMHACFSIPGTTQLLARIMLTKKKLRDHEEEFIAYLSSILVGVTFNGKPLVSL